jgi:hypothetical protein
VIAGVLSLALGLLALDRWFKPWRERERVESLVRQEVDRRARSAPPPAPPPAARAEPAAPPALEQEDSARALREKVRREIDAGNEEIRDLREKVEQAPAQSEEVARLRARVQELESKPAEPAAAGGSAAVEPASPPPGRPSLGPTAVTDPGQVRRLLEGINTLLGGVGGTETWRVVSAEAVEGDSLIRAVLEVRGQDDALLKTLRAEEARFQVQTAAGTLTIRLREGSVTFPGNRSAPFPDGRYTALLQVDPQPFRVSGSPLVGIR